ncbi:hypothetical protein ABN764_16200 [Paenibacillaceae sp. P-4]|uniref:Uncharacterized protein n=1 Tax=Paenibacillus popilliae TaxID=78057 RepID=A0ABY3AQC4_PAEPP|nr:MULTISPECIES: hypothetical protein [unclassified Paenibacillus]OBY77784.1 hypothetical protein BBG47_20045 [Paenibacillus sp. KS1]TQR44201.1 hypothetical protein C7Y44_13660 [Paenibacillus sp. SDF0028]
MLRTAMFTIGFIALLIGGFLWMSQQQKGLDPALLSIVKNYVGRDGLVHDVTNDIGVESVEDVGFKKKGDVLEVFYGKMNFNIQMDETLQEAVQNLRKLGIVLSTDEAGNVKLTYNGEAVKQFE